MKKIPILISILATIWLPATAETLFMKPLVMPTLRVTTIKVAPAQSVKTNKQNQAKSVEPERLVKAQESYPTTADNCTCEHASKLYEQGKYKEAAFYYNKTAEIMLGQYKHENSDIADMRYGQGLCYYMLGDYVLRIPLKLISDSG